MVQRTRCGVKAPAEPPCAAPTLHVFTDPATEAAAGPVHAFARLVEARSRNDAAEGRRRIHELRKLGYVVAIVQASGARGAGRGPA